MMESMMIMTEPMTMIVDFGGGVDDDDDDNGADYDDDDGGDDDWVGDDDDDNYDCFDINNLGFILED